MKRFIKKTLVLLASVTTLFSCAELDSTVDSGIMIEKPISVVINEKVSSYDVLKSYSDGLVLGVNASLADISGTGTMASLLKTNFDHVTPLTELNSNVILLNDGSCDFTAINEYISKAGEKEFSVYGDVIVSNLNQNDTYLKTVGAPLTYTTPLYPNIINQAPIYDGSFTGWTNAGDIVVQDYMGEPAIKMVNGTSTTSGDATSLQSPVYTVDANAKFELTFYILSTQVGEGRVVFSGLNNNEPAMDWMGTGVPTSTFTTKIGWNTIKVKTTDFNGSGQFSFKIELGYTPDVAYYMNIQGLSLVNLNGSVDNPDEIFLECENAQQIGQWMITQDNATASGGKTVVGIINGDVKADNATGGSPTDPANQVFMFTYTFNVRTAGTYRFWIRQKAHVADNGYDSFFMSVDGATFYCPGYPAWGAQTNTTDWTWFQLYTNSSNISGSSLFNFTAGEHKASIRIREGGHYFDRMYFTMTTNVPSGMGSAAIAQKQVTLNVSDDVRTAAVEEALRNYVSTVITTLDEKINAWTVVKNPFAEDGTVATSNGSTATGTYYWADYIGSDYIVQAFGVAKANAVSGTKLFIAETALNTNSNKLNAVISSVNTIAEIDGVAVSLDLNTDSDLDEISAMFDGLAATGKLIYINNLKVAISEQTTEAYALQAEVYKSVLELYKSKVPASQQYGISLYSAVDNNTGLWDTNYNRKQAYAGFCVGMGADN